MPAVVIALKIGRRSLAAQITVDALIIDIKFARYILRVFVRCIRHNFSVK
jgi:hypothetical protein